MEIYTNNRCGTPVRTKDTFGIKGFVAPGDTVSKLSFSKGKIAPTKNGGGRSKTIKY